ncbi:hypothetical protein L9F63_023105, partial [Diploptera punctata]
MNSTLEQHGISNRYKKLMDVPCQDQENRYGHLTNMPPSRDSVAFTSTKGLLNGPGQNNCFLNSAVQAPMQSYMFLVIALLFVCGTN